MAGAVNKPEHSSFWWVIKVACGFALIAGLFGRFLVLGPALVRHPITEIPIVLAQLLVIVGGVSYLWHYRVLKRQNSNVGVPRRLTSSGGLFGLVRHPLYLSDTVTYIGLALLNLTPISLLLLALGLIALFRQAVVEDVYMQQKFPQPYASWSVKTKLIVPYIY